MIDSKKLIKLYMQEHKNIKMTTGERNSFFLSINDEVAKELRIISKRYNVDIFQNTILRYYEDHRNKPVGTIATNMKELERILKAYGYTNEDVTNYIVKNGLVAINDRKSLLIKLYIFQKANLLEEVLFNKRSYISNQTALGGLSDRLLCAYAKSRNYDFELQELDLLKVASKEYKEYLMENYKLDRKELSSLMIDFEDYLQMLEDMKKQDNEGEDYALKYRCS